jgi:multidrug resistance efflux pump
MKTRLFIFWILLLLFSCSGKKDEDNLSATRSTIAAVNQVIGIGRIEPENQILQLASETGGIVERVLVSENDSVKKGGLIIELAHGVEQATVNQLEKQVATQAAQIKADETAISESRVRYQHATSELERLERLFSKGAETKQAVDNASTDMKAYEANIARLQSLVEVSRTKLVETKSQLEVSRQQLELKFVRAPVNGKILEINCHAGEAIEPRQSFGQLSPEGRIIAVCEMDELFAGKVRTGQPAWIRNPGSADTLSGGKVYFTSSFLKKKSLFTDQAGEKEDRRVREIKILLDHPDHLLLNARVECVVDISNPSK